MVKCFTLPPRIPGSHIGATPNPTPATPQSPRRTASNPDGRPPNLPISATFTAVTRRPPLRLALLAAVLGPACLAHAQPAAGPSDLRQPRGGLAALRLDERRAWNVQLEGRWWYPALNGSVQIAPGDSFEVEVVDADEPRSAPLAELTIRDGRFVFEASGFGYGFDQTKTAKQPFTAGGITFDRGDPVDVTIDYISAEATAGYSFPSIVGGKDKPVDLFFDVYAGARMYDVDVGLGVPGGTSVLRGDTWIDPIVGFRMNLDMPEGLGLEVSLDAGGWPIGDNTSFTWDVTVAFQWMVTPNAGVEVGFRHLSVDHSAGSGDGRFEFDAALAGLFAGVAIRF